MRILTCVACLCLALAGPAVGQQVTCVAVGGDDASMREMYMNRVEWTFAKPAEGCGTVNKHAMIATSPAGLKVAIDAAEADAAKPDLLRFDFAGEGKFNNEMVVPIKNWQDRGGNVQADFGPVTLQVKVGADTIPATIRGVYYKYDSNRTLFLMIGAAVEAECKFGDKAHKVRLLDKTSNLKFADPAKPQGQPGMAFQPGDAIVIDPIDAKGQAPRIAGYYGHPVRVDGKWYNVALSADGKTITAEPSKVPLGQAKAAAANWSCTLVGEKLMLTLSGGTEPIDLPADNYVVASYEVKSAPDAAGKAAVLERISVSSKRVKVAEGGSADLPIGAPLTAKIEATAQGRNVQLMLLLTDASGDRVTNLALANGQRPTPPDIDIVDAEGKSVYKTSLEYG